MLHVVDEHGACGRSVCAQSRTRCTLFAEGSCLYAMATPRIGSAGAICTASHLLPAIPAPTYSSGEDVPPLKENCDKM